MNKRKLRLAVAAMKDRETSVSDLCQELGVSRTTLYTYMDPKGQLRFAGEKMLQK